jgi:hypothetical protein
METLTHVFIIYCIIFTLWMCFKWSTKTFADSMIKVSLFLISLIGIVIEFKVLNII